jgi:hypothetical protein
MVSFPALPSKNYTLVAMLQKQRNNAMSQIIAPPLKPTMASASQTKANALWTLRRGLHRVSSTERRAFSGLLNVPRRRCTSVWLAIANRSIRRGGGAAYQGRIVNQSCST